MKAFVSYSFRDSELYIIALLFEQLRKSGYVVEGSSIGFSQESNNLLIPRTDIFIGIITNNSSSINHVISEWNVAKRYSIRNILIIEDGVKIEDSTLQYIRFNRNNAQQAIDQLFNIRENSNQTQTSSGLEDALVVGGIIVGIAALLSLLSKK